MKPSLFFCLAIGFLLLLSGISAYVLGVFLGGNQRKNFWKILKLNILAFIAMFAYMLAQYSYTLAEILVRFSIMYFVLIAVATIISMVIIVMEYFYKKTRQQTISIDTSRRAFLRKLVFLPATGVSLYGGLYESSAIEYNEIKVKTTNKKLQTVVMAQVSDVHLGLFFSVAKLQQVLAKCVEQGANLLVLTGDIFDSNILNPQAIKAIDKFVPLFPYGVYFCWGNHEHMRNMELIKRELAKTKIKVLTNEAVKLFSQPDSVYILGVDYVESREDNDPRRRAMLNQAMANVPEDSYKILLAHHPYFIDDGFRANIDLILTGHTHGGQVMIFKQPVLPIFKYMAGSFKEGNKLGFVSRGTGSWFPFRLGCAPEVVFFKFY